MNGAPRAWLVDASVYIFRAWFSMPDRWHTPAGMPLNAVVGYAGFLYDALAQTHPDLHVAAAFDESLGSCFRNEIFPGYKASRELPDEALAFQLQACRELTERAGVPCFGGPRYEADDYLASLARLAREQGLPVTVLTRDKDLGQLLQHAEDRWWDFAAQRSLDAAGFEAQFGVAPRQFADYLALVGDAVDDIPGVPGIGPKTAAALLQAYDSLEGIADNAGQMESLPLRGAKRLWQRLEPHWEQALLARRLARLEAHVPELEAMPACSRDADGNQAVVDYLRELGLGGPLVARWNKLGRAP
ncbi:flap endonuclease [Mangrovimicrobium sediminis]|uniref:Flap endonuclease n=1 Tax=Mangrovimicrobium sediminis TaxID=2562682 RepID=A0A4Z0M768_9GAMM|nr:5'-3' exonuclease H3TH domain-containing protein [Haliea sp. SAOS-164]TGD75237.1 flap endonuclease [Haliea sp. SAOS-164]